MTETLASLEMAWSCLTEWQRSHYGTVSAELCRNLPSRVPEKAIHGEMSPQKHPTLKAAGEAAGGWVLLTIMHQKETEDGEAASAQEPAE